ncbi:allophanate hydrolase [Paenibacillus humicola]|uniref:allophanate hydrolase n=1 Tax=Paenibacillus humicola TaxID=3110540 RepID=UPI00237B2E76|nr:allophanate hydrolase [Paenibacillus humicola]
MAEDELAKGKLTPEELVLELVRRAKEDAELNIWITPPDMETARPYLERLRGTDPTSLPLWGIPFAVKDNIDAAGFPTTAACPAFAYEPAANAAVVERLIAAGAIPLGKTNLDQFATGLVGTRSPYGETANALRQELISGGSSSGSAVAVARGHAAVALGTDTAGSGRVPAALNGLVGFKASVGAWPSRGTVPACASIDCITVFAHTTEDALAIDAAVRGFDPEDPWSRAFPQTEVALPGKIFLPKEGLPFFGPFGREYEAAWNSAVERIESLGLPVESIDYAPFAEAASLLYDGPWVAERWADLGEFAESHPGELFPVTERVLRTGASSALTAASAFKSMHTLQELRRKVRLALKDAVLILPTCGGTWSREQVRRDPVAANSAMGLYTNHCNLLELCAIAVPAGYAAADTPFGISCFALAGQDGLIGGMAMLLQGGTPPAKPAPDDSAPDANMQGTNTPGASAPDANTQGANTPDANMPDASTPDATTLNAYTPVAVCGLHMRGFPLERQMAEHSARFIRQSATAAKYKLVRLNTSPAKPGLIRQLRDGSSIEVEIWEMPLAAFGAFAGAIPAPLGIGRIELEDGTEVPGFLCEGYAESESEDISTFGGWRGYTASFERVGPK